MEERDAMANDSEHVATLKAAREQQIAARRQLAAALGAPYKRGETERLREGFIDVPATIEAIDRALAHEERLSDGTTSTAAGFMPPT
jgi:hypothetical protein